MVQVAGRWPSITTNLTRAAALLRKMSTGDALKYVRISSMSGVITSRRSKLHPPFVLWFAQHEEANALSPWSMQNVRVVFSVFPKGTQQGQKHVDICVLLTVRTVFQLPCFRVKLMYKVGAFLVLSKILVHFLEFFPLSAKYFTRQLTLPTERHILG